METTNDYINRVIRFMDSTKENDFILIESISSDPKRFTEAIKFSIDQREKSYEFSADFKRVRRISQ